MMRYPQPPRARAMLILGVAGLSYVLVFWLAGAFDLFDRSGGKLIPIVMGVAIVLVAYRYADRLLSGGEE